MIFSTLIDKVSKKIMENSDSAINRDVHDSAKEENHLVFIYHRECKKITCVCGMVIEGPHTCPMLDMFKSGQTVRVISNRLIRANTLMRKVNTRSIFIFEGWII